MDIDQLKMILDTVGGVSGDVKGVAIGVIAVWAGKAVLEAGLIAIGIYAAYKTIIRIVSKVSESVNNGEHLKMLRNRVVGPSKYTDRSNYEVTFGDLREINKVIDKGLNK